MRKLLFGAALGSTFALLCACETRPPESMGPMYVAPAGPVAGPAAPTVSLEGLAVDSPIVGLAGAVWSDPGNSGYVTGYTYQGHYFPGAPPGYDPGTHSVVPR